MRANSIKNLIKKIFEHLGYEIMPLERFSTEMTEKERILSLIGRLSPVITDKELVRIGPKGDGGYLVPNDLEEIVACFSPGVDKSSGFELDCAKLGMNVFLADMSVDAPPDSHPLFHFTKKHVGAFTAGTFMTIDDWVFLSVNNAEAEIILQIDIENYEYEALLSMSDQLMQRARIIIIEFHSLDQLWNKPFYNLASRAFEKLLNTHTCVHIHPNNCCRIYSKNGIEIPPIAEFSFLRNDRIVRRSRSRKFPHPLDCDSTTNSHITLPSCWYNNSSNP